MNITPEQLHERIVAAISRELHLADVGHDQTSIHYSAFCNRADLPADRQEARYDSRTGERYGATVLNMGDAMAGMGFGTLYGRDAE